MSTTLLAFVEWFNTFEVSRTLLASALASVATLALWGALMLVLVADADFQYSHLAVIFVLLVYPTLALLVGGVWKWKDDGWARSRFVVVSLSLASVLVLGFFVAVAFFEVFVGMALISLFVVAAAIAGGIALWIHNGYKTSRALRYTFLLAMVLLAGLGVAGGMYRRSFMTGFTLAWTALAVLAGAYGVSAAHGPRNSAHSPAHYEAALLFPVLALETHGTHRCTLVRHDGPAAAMFAVLFLLVVWGVVASAGLQGYEWVGLGVLSIALTWILTAVLHLTALTRARFADVRRFK